MSTHPGESIKITLIAQVTSCYDGHVIAFFDLDETILAHANGMNHFMKHLLIRRQISVYKLVRGLWFGILHRLNRLDVPLMYERLGHEYKGMSVTETEQRCHDWFHQSGHALICQSARTAIETHRQLGHTLAILSSSPRFICAPFARALNITHILCTELQTHGDTFTGNVIRPVCYGTGKLIKSQQLADSLGTSLQNCTFYTDSASDLPVLQMIGHPKIVNPDMKLKHIALTNQWPILSWS